MNKKLVKLSLTAASATLAVTAVAGVSSADTPTFKDVPADHVFYNEIETLAKAGVVNGVGDGYFNPTGTTTRGELAKMLVKALDLKTDAPTLTFNDVPQNHIFYNEIATLASLNITIGTGYGEFQPDLKVTRQEIALFVSRALQITSDTKSNFTDVTLYETAINALYDKGILKGTSETTFDPEKTATRGEAAAIIARALNYDHTRPYSLDVMHVNDVHAYNENYPKLATAVQTTRVEKRDSLLLNAGDVFSGTLYFNVYEGASDSELLNLLNFDAQVFGNHEFDLGSSTNGHKALQTFVKNANYPFLAANVDFSKDPLFDGLQSRAISSTPEDGKIYNAIIKEVKGEKVGIIGLTTAETADISSPGSIAFENYVQAAQATVDGLEAAGINKIIALTHIGYDDNPQVDNDVLLAKTVEGIDLIVGGHSHTQLDKPVVVDKDLTDAEKDPTIIVQAYQYLDFLGTVSLEFDTDGVVTNYDGKLIKVSNFAADSAVSAVLAKYTDGVNEYKTKKIGVNTAIDLLSPRTETDSVRKNETILGNLVTDGMLWKARSSTSKTVILAVQNGGGIRSDIKSGDITVGQIKTVLPFANTLAIVDLKGSEIKEMFEHSVRLLPAENGGFLHVAGARVTYDSTKAAGERVVSVEYKDDQGAYIAIPFDDTVFTIASNAFTIKGGDGFTGLLKAYNEGRATDFGSVDSDNFEAYLVEFGNITAENAKLEGRLVDLKGAQ